MRRFGPLFLIYVGIGVYIAWTHHYLDVHVLKIILQALLAIFLWFLIVLGVDLHVH